MQEYARQREMSRKRVKKSKEESKNGLFIEAREK